MGPYDSTLQMFVQTLPRISPANQQGESFAAERVDHARGIDPAPARRFARGVDVRAILKGQAIDADHTVNRRINSKSDNQV